MLRMPLIFGLLSMVVSSFTNGCVTEIRPPDTYCFNEGKFKGHAVYIGRQETDPNGQKVFHVSVQGPFSVSEEQGVKIIPLFGHMPFSDNAITRTSLDKCEVEFAPEYMLKNGIDVWKEQNGGVYSIPIDDAISLGLETMQPSTHANQEELLVFSPRA